ncbi:HI1506-related protein [Chromohalobacter israelensis]|uniref:HI1506-related protein n=1 Tax=Chromohalobacter israelensis TaxID=141390 RepID=UPI00265BF5E6|nr:HI1506-related protein [Chromohalobacter salexigens]MDO0944654.1 HI1506-related protein [Chromohalobacter salexigens]
MAARKTPSPQAKAQQANASEPAPTSQEGEKINTPPAGTQAQGKQDEIPMLYVRTKKRFGSRRRAGFRFNREGFGIALDALSDEQVASLKADPTLVVEEGTVPASEAS